MVTSSSGGTATMGPSSSTATMGPRACMVSSSSDGTATMSPRHRLTAGLGPPLPQCKALDVRQVRGAGVCMRHVGTMRPRYLQKLQYTQILTTNSLILEREECLGGAIDRKVAGGRCAAIKE
jgi:hypothetical protein